MRQRSVQRYAMLALSVTLMLGACGDEETAESVQDVTQESAAVGDPSTTQKAAKPSPAKGATPLNECHEAPHGTPCRNK